MFITFGVITFGVECNAVYYIKHCITLEVVTYGPLVSLANLYALGHTDVHSRLEDSSTSSDKRQFTDT